MNENPPWRLIADLGAPAAWNMAVDEALLDRYANACSPIPPTLRLYGFSPAALSLGRFQDAWANHRPDFLRERGIALVRRPSGGGAVLHDRERTYAVVGMLRVDPFDGGVVETYRRIAEALSVALAELGAAPRIEPAGARGRGGGRRDEPACFGAVSSHEITAGGRKLVGSAQLRRRGAFLQHGSIPLRTDDTLLSGACGFAPRKGSATDLETAVGQPVTLDRLDASLRAAFEAAFEARLEPAALTAQERVAATRLYSWKYGSTAWTHAGRVGPREAARLDPGASRGAA